MNKGLRELLGKTLQEKRRRHYGGSEWPWKKRLEEAKEADRRCAEAVVSKYVEIITPYMIAQFQWQSGRAITEDELLSLLGLESDNATRKHNEEVVL